MSEIKIHWMRLDIAEYQSILRHNNRNYPKLSTEKKTEKQIARLSVTYEHNIKLFNI